MTDEPLWSDTDGKLYATPAWLEGHTGKPHRTIRTWIRREQARSITANGILYAHIGDVLRLARRDGYLTRSKQPS